MCVSTSRRPREPPACCPLRPPAHARSRSSNHEHAGASLSAPDLPESVKKGGFMTTKTRLKARRSGAALPFLGARRPVVRAAGGPVGATGALLQAAPPVSSAGPAWLLPCGRCPPPQACPCKEGQSPLPHGQASGAHPGADASPNQPSLHAPQVGSGKQAYDAAVKAIKDWEHLQLGGS